MAGKNLTRNELAAWVASDLSGLKDAKPEAIDYDIVNYILNNSNEVK